MKKHVTILLLLVVTGWATAGWKPLRKDKQPSLCANSSFASELCLEMRYLRVHIMLLGEQRELLQVNYRMLELLSRSLQQILARLSNSPLYDEHLQGIEEIRTTADELNMLAQLNKPDALVQANALGGHCTHCHQNPMPSRQLYWHDLALISWDHIAKRCNEPGRHPYLCKKMYAMVSSLAYFQEALNRREVNYELAAEAARELVRISNDLQRFRPHGDSPELSVVEQKATEIMRLAANRDVKFLELGSGLTNTCFHCHK